MEDVKIEIPIVVKYLGQNPLTEYIDKEITPGVVLKSEWIEFHKALDVPNIDHLKLIIDFTKDVAIPLIATILANKLTEKKSTGTISQVITVNIENVTINLIQQNPEEVRKTIESVLTRILQQNTTKRDTQR
ncbi:hypothetical protein X802_00985 [Thermococcus guaymasensis DSM 11113]|uniref:Uncharacterized protein n=1 Tax=Thermococcus guaymasensis DSM 11113 TaxID=1432656 RepID=A0A0X1KN03_9EURY|nr:hypothetical protein [Thermococcus guaymasensis]AJC72628.1 hypothetical protein X802_00985 [Thermococcus guaymasensis DSM 11113]